MLEKTQKLVEKLTIADKTISAMESCTGGGFANLITNVEGASKVLNFSAVTYSNESKIKFGVSKDTIKKYTVYSKEVAKEMSKAIALFASSDYGVGITGQLKRKDPANPTDAIDADKVYIAIYHCNTNSYWTKTITVTKNTRIENKAIILDEILNYFIKKVSEI